jgi:hypothetical protein
VAGSVEKAISDFGSITFADEKRSKRWYEEIFRIAQDESKVTIVEVGVALGGSLAIAGCALVDSRAHEDSELIGFDTFDNLFNFTQIDSQTQEFKKKLESEMNLTLRKGMPINAGNEAYAVALQNVRSSGFGGKISLIRGDAVSTVAQFSNIKSSKFVVSALRISCNWYKPVSSSVKYLVPRVEDNGVIFLDGYFFWSGFRQAVDEVMGTRVESLGARIGDCLVISGQVANSIANSKR